MDFISVERIVELLHLEEEPPGTVDPPAWWPSTGDILFEGVTIRYAPQYDPSLFDVSFRIPGGSTTALLGLTGMPIRCVMSSWRRLRIPLGSGKSTLVLSLLAISRLLSQHQR